MKSAASLRLVEPGFGDGDGDGPPPPPLIDSLATFVARLMSNDEASVELALANFEHFARLIEAKIDIIYRLRGGAR